MADWSSVALSAVSASAGVVGGVIGYLGARLQAGVGLRQVDAETERMRVAHAEEHLRNRQATYHNFIDIEQRFLAMVSHHDLPSRATYDAWVTDYHHSFDGTVLFGTEDVRAAAEAINSVHYQIHNAHLREQGNFGERFQAAYFAHQTAYREKRIALIQAMRNDVAPAPGQL